MLQEITRQAKQAVTELLESARLQAGDILVVGCSSSEVLGERIGTASSMDAAGAVLDGVLPVLQQHGVYLAAQCCEHLNRAIIVEAAAAKERGLSPVNVLPQPKAGGSLATTAWQRMENPVAVESIQAEAGIDIGGTLIGMHLKPVAVPVRLTVRQIGQAPLLCARTRPKFIGGSRAVYDETRL
ncbi:MAG: TIGR01440 family protein [Clostridia bacterium]|nr:TIGR01440 family protein [Loktanella sp.]MBQ1950951.1 TIGR01440 family protein [Clostridia bacterium]